MKNVLMVVWLVFLMVFGWGSFFWARAQEGKGDVTIAPIATPMQTAAVGTPSLTFSRDAGGVAACDSCHKPMTAPMPKLADPDALLSDVSMFPCFECGELHLIGRLLVKKASGGVFKTDTWLEWVWKPSTRSWKVRKQ